MHIIGVAFTLLALIVASYQWSSISLTSGSPYSSATISLFDISACVYYSINVPAGTGAVQIDVQNPASSAGTVAISAGFNYYPRAANDPLNGNSFLFGDSNGVGSGTSGRYFVCTYDPVTTFAAKFGIPTSSSSANSGYCAAYAPDMHNGGTLYICASVAQVPSVVFLNNLQPTVTLTTIAATPITLGSNTQLQVSASDGWGALSAYKMYIPPTITSYTNGWNIGNNAYLSAGGLVDNIYTTNNTASYGWFQVNQTFYAVLISTATSAVSATFTPTPVACDFVNNFPVTVQQICAPMMAITAGPTYITPTSQYAAYNLTVPSTSSGPLNFYKLRVTIPNTYNNVSAYNVQVFFSGQSWASLDPNVGPSGALATGNSAAGTQYYNTMIYEAHWLIPGSNVQFVIQSMTANQTVPFNAMFLPETQTNLVFSYDVLGTNSSFDQMQSPGDNILYYMLYPFTSTGSNGMVLNLFTDVYPQTSTIAGAWIITSDFKNFVVSTNTNPSNRPITFYENLPSGNYYLVAIPQVSGARLVTASVGGASTLTYSFSVVLVAILALLTSFM